MGPEPSDLGHGGGKYGGSPGRLTQAITSEHLAHVIFGHHDLQVRAFNPDIQLIQLKVTY